MKEYNYSARAKDYDILEKNNNIDSVNNIIDKFFKKNKVQSVLDIACGTGSQSIFLSKKGYDVTPSDSSKKMVTIAQKKYSKLNFLQADMRSINLGKFDAVISIFNAIGHLSKIDFNKALQNIYTSLNPRGLYVFDILNLEAISNNLVPYEFIDSCKEVNGVKYVRFNRNIFDKNNAILTINQKTYIQKGINKPKITKDSWDMQIYSSNQLTNILEKKGFEIVNFLSIEKEEFSPKRSSSILTFARKKQV